MPPRRLQGWDPNQGQLPGFEGRGAPTGLTGGGTLGIDSSDLTKLHDRLGVVIRDVDKLSSSIERLTSNLTEAGKAWGPMTGTRGGVGGTLTVSSFGSPPGRAANLPAAAIVGAGGGTNLPNAANKNTAAPVSAFGGGQMNRAIALGALGEIGAQAGGAINTYMSGIRTGGMPTDVIARQTAGMFGGVTSRYVNSYTGISNMGTQDLNTALATLQANPMLFNALRRGSQQQRGLTAFMNTVQGLNPLLGAAGAANVANQLTSGPTLQALQRFGARNGQMGQGLINPRNMNVNSPQRIFSEMLQAVMGGRQLTPAQMRAMAGNTRDWTMITQNNNVPGMGLGLSPQMLVELRQFAAAGGNLSAIQRNMGNAPAATGLQRTTAQSKMQETIFQQTVTEQNLVNKGLRDMDNILTRLAGSNGVLPNVVAGFASVGGGLLTLGSHIASAIALFKIAKSLGGGGGGGGGLVGRILSKVGGGGGVTGEGLATGEAATAGAEAGGISLAGLGTATGVGAAGIAAFAGTTALLHNTPAGGAVRSAANWLHIGRTMRPTARLGGGSSYYLKEVAAGTIHDPHLTKSQAKQALQQGYVSGDPTGSTTTQGMQPNLARGVSAMMAANPNLRISSGHRTRAQQSFLYSLKGGRGVAKPGQSMHERGQAADLGPPSQFGWIAKNASKFGLQRPAPRSEPWHVQAMGDPTPSASNAVSGSQVVSVARTALGTPYVWGGESPNGYDCSGLVQMVFAKVGISLPRTSQQQASSGKPVGSLAQAQPGDIILYNEPGEGPNSHVAIYIGNGMQIAAPHTGTVVQVQPVDKAHISTIRRVVGGGAGNAVVQAAQQSVGSPSKDSHAAGMGGTQTTLANTFLQNVSSTWLTNGPGGGVAPGGGATGVSSTSTGTSSSSVVSGSTAVLSGGNAGNISNPTAFSKAILAGLGFPATVADVTDINAWQQHEGQWGAKGIFNAAQMHNPLNTKLKMPGSVSIGGGQTVSYPTWAEGISATISTIKQGNMKGIYSALQANANLSSFGSALEGTPWASSAYGGASFNTPSGVYAVGDPVSGSTASPSMSMGRSTGGRNITVNMPIQMVGLSQQEAQQMAHMVMEAIREAEHQDAVAGF